MLEFLLGRVNGPNDVRDQFRRDPASVKRNDDVLLLLLVYML
jgi:hypothetical protein